MAANRKWQTLFSSANTHSPKRVTFPRLPLVGGIIYLTQQASWHRFSPLKDRSHDKPAQQQSFPRRREGPRLARKPALGRWPRVRLLRDGRRLDGYREPPRLFPVQRETTPQTAHGHRQYGIRAQPYPAEQVANGRFSALGLREG